MLVAAFEKRAEIVCDIGVDADRLLHAADDDVVGGLPHRPLHVDAGVAVAAGPDGEPPVVAVEDGLDRLTVNWA